MALLELAHHWIQAAVQSKSTIIVNDNSPEGRYNADSVGGPVSPFPESSRRETAPAHGRNATRRVVLAERAGAVDGEQPRELRAGTIDPALDRPYRAPADRSRLLVRETRRTDEKQSLALAGRQRCKRHAKFLEFHTAVWFGMRRQTLRIGAVCVFDLATPLAVFRAEQVAEDGDQPGGHVRSRLERIDAGYGAQERFLHEIVRAVGVAAE
jgi:hypothetical protein